MSPAVVLMDDPDVISPLMLGTAKDLTDDFSLDRPGPRPYLLPKPSRKLSGRPSISALTRSPELMSSSASLVNQTSMQSQDDDEQKDSSAKPSEVLGQIAGWLAEQKAKRIRRHAANKTEKPGTYPPVSHSTDGQQDDQTDRRRRSDASDTSLALDKLEQILAKSSILQSSAESIKSRRSSRATFTPSSFRKLRRQSSVVASDSEDPDRDHDRVPGCDAYLDNSKTLSYAGGASVSQLDLTDPAKAAAKDQEAWNNFKWEIVRLAHTLRLKGWRHIPMSLSSEIGVNRLSGALTNAVYMVSPPSDFSLPAKSPRPGHNPSVDSLTPRKPPPKLLLRIYGPQVEHLIDRESELQILRRLARKRIGPRLLGTFANGRFEEYFHAETLRPQDLRIPETSRQIAKRMRELHEGIDLLPSERDAGPYVWRNWDKWVDRAAGIVEYLDRQVSSSEPPCDPAIARLKSKGLICGTSWSVFRAAVDRYRAFLAEQYNGEQNIHAQLVFAHNDTQYGNILRLQPPGESPLLLPANSHRQLVVIDFEYANANTPGFELANHFSEWCYNYHDPDTPFACRTEHYPGPDEQLRFASAYLAHSPYFHAPGSTVSSPVLQPARTAPDALTRPALPPGAPAASDIDAAARQLLHETRLWRVACSAQWTAWGIVQAVVPGFDGGAAAKGEAEEPVSPASTLTPPTPRAETTAEQESAGTAEEEAEAEEEFDYLSYARERAMFFWGDMLQLGLATREEVGAAAKDVKVVGM